VPLQKSFSDERATKEAVTLFKKTGDGKKKGLSPNGVKNWSIASGPLSMLI
jgi:hypothetical protein